ncbi:MAG: hypothetical protein DWQ01_17410 [Planctomycetota bacterium]|nr:MAG: hypothetical protein DWQ01_17410 [Planctomycetota bacterium]
MIVKSILPLALGLAIAGIFFKSIGKPEIHVSPSETEAFSEAPPPAQGRRRSKNPDPALAEEPPAILPVHPAESEVQALIDSLARNHLSPVLMDYSTHLQLLEDLLKDGITEVRRDKKREIITGKGSHGLEIEYCFGRGHYLIFSLPVKDSSPFENFQELFLTMTLSDNGRPEDGFLKLIEGKLAFQVKKKQEAIEYFQFRMEDSIFSQYSWTLYHEHGCWPAICGVFWVQGMILVVNDDQSFRPWWGTCQDFSLENHFFPMERFSQLYQDAYSKIKSHLESQRMR